MNIRSKRVYTILLYYYYYYCWDYNAKRSKQKNTIQDMYFYSCYIALNTAQFLYFMHLDCIRFFNVRLICFSSEKRGDEIIANFCLYSVDMRFACDFMRWFYLWFFIFLKAVEKQAFLAISAIFSAGFIESSITYFWLCDVGAFFLMLSENGRWMGGTPPTGTERAGAVGSKVSPLLFFNFFWKNFFVWYIR